MASITTHPIVPQPSIALLDPGTVSTAPGEPSNAKMSIDSFKPPRTLVLCFDGTSNQYDGANTNVVKFYSLLKKDVTDQQLCYYQPGVGTYLQPGLVAPMFQWGAKMLDEAVAWYLDAHVRGGYEFLMQNWRAGDKICIFGFSRGAYTARALAGLVHKIGLLPKDNPEQVPFAYKLFKRTDAASISLAGGFKQTFCRDVKIEFVGVWDTVASVGILTSKTLPFTTANTTIKTFRHALSLDERRAKFRPNLYHRPTQDNTPSPSPTKDPSPVVESPTSLRPQSIAKSRIGTEISNRAPSRTPSTTVRNRRNSRFFPFRRKAPEERKQAAERHRPFVGKNRLKTQAPQGELTTNLNDPSNDNVGQTDVKEVWFAGTHGDVGGGCVPNSDMHCLADIPLRWMVREVAATQCGIQFDSDALARANIPPSIFSRDGFPLEAYLKPCKPPLVIHNGAPVSAAAGTEARPLSTGADRDAARPSTDSGISMRSRSRFWAKAKDVQPPIDPDDDALQPLHDQLKADPAWWLLEVVPTDYTWQDGRGQWHTHWGLHLGRGRHIPDINPMFHESVKHRMKVLKYEPAAVWKKGTEMYVS